MNAVPRRNRATHPTGTLAIVALALGLITALMPATTARADDTVTIPDANLAACISAELTKESLPPDFTAANLAALTTLSCSTAVADLTGIQALSGLGTLKLSSVSATDVTALGTLTGLTTLQLYAANLVDPSPLSQLIGLTRLSLSASNVTSLDFAKPLTNITWLAPHLSSTADLAALKDLPKLDVLTLWGDAANDPVLADLTSVTDLWVSTTATTLQGLILPPSTKALTIGDNNLVTLADLPGSGSVTSLALYTNKLTNVDGIGQLPNLTSVSVYSPSLSDASALIGETQLHKVVLYSASITSLADVAQIPELRDLNITASKVTSLAPLHGRPLTRLIASDTELQSAEPLAGMALTELDLSYNALTSLAGVASAIAPNAKVNLASDHLTDVAPITSFPTGTTINLANNQISDISALADIPANTTINLSGNRIRDFSPLPDDSAVTTDHQVVDFPGTTAGVPIDLGLRTVTGQPVCPDPTVGVTCADGVATFAYAAYFSVKAGATYQGSVAVAIHRPSAPIPPVLHDNDHNVWPRWIYFDFDQSYWWPQPTSWDVRWYRDGKLIQSTTGVQQPFVRRESSKADLNHNLTVCITGYGGPKPTETVCSAPLAITRGTFPTMTLKIKGTPRVGHLLRLHRTGDVPGDTTEWTQWLRDGHPIKYQYDDTYRLRKADRGHRISVRITMSNPAFVKRTQTSAPTARIKR